MKTISIIIIAIIISLVLSSPNNDGKKYLKSSSLLKAFTNLASCKPEETAAFTLFIKPATDTFVLFNIDSTNFIYYYINNKHILLVQLKDATEYTKFQKLEIYNYTSVLHSGSEKIHDVSGTLKISYALKADGTGLDGNHVYYVDGDSAATKYEIQLVGITGATTPIQSSCAAVNYVTASTTAVDLLSTAKTYIDIDYAATIVPTNTRESAITYEAISGKRITTQIGNTFKTFYTKYNKLCSVEFDGPNKYTVYNSTYTNTPTVTEIMNKLMSISEPTSTSKIVITCSGTSTERTCTPALPIPETKLKYTIVQSTATGKPLHLYKNQVYYGKNIEAPTLTVETLASKKINEIWPGCLGEIADTTAKVNDIGKYKYNIFIIALSLILII